jgi:hypothetical protein
VHSATQIIAFQEWKLEFKKMFNNKPLLISADKSLLSYCTVIVLAVSGRQFFFFMLSNFLVQTLQYLQKVAHEKLKKHHQK